MPDADEPEVPGDLEERFLANEGIQAAVVEALAHPERQVRRLDRGEREALRRDESGD